MIATLANTCWRLSNFPGCLRFGRLLEHPERAQQSLLMHYLHTNAQTAFGRAHGFARIHTAAEFQKRVPATSYEEYSPFINRILEGESHVLTHDAVTSLLPSSGSAGARKLIPYTRTLQREFGRGIGAWVWDLFRQHPSAARGRAYWSVTPVAWEKDTASSAVPIGFDDDSAYVGGLAQQLVRSVMAVPGDVRLLREMECFRYVTLLHLLKCRDLRLISVWHPSFLSLLLEALPGYWESLLRDLHDGTLHTPVRIPSHLARILTPCASRRRARELSLLSPSRPAELWPDLAVVSAWGDGHARAMLPRLSRLVPHAAIQPKGLIATEAFVTLPYQHRHPLAISSHFFEFAEPASATGDDAGRPLLSHELRAGGEYSVLVTTGGGLYRYRMHDRVRVTGFLGRTPCLEFLGKEDRISDQFGEKLSEAFVSAALQEVFARLGFHPEFVLLAPDGTEDEACYTLYLEANVIPDGLAPALDVALSASPHYAYCRRLGQLGAVRLYRVTVAAYSLYVQHTNQRLGSIKPAALSAGPHWTGRFPGYYCPAAETPAARSQ